MSSFNNEPQHRSNLTQRKRAGLIPSHDTLKSLDRNQELLFCTTTSFFIFSLVVVTQCSLLTSLCNLSLTIMRVHLQCTSLRFATLNQRWSWRSNPTCRGHFTGKMLELRSIRAGNWEQDRTRRLPMQAMYATLYEFSSQGSLRRWSRKYTTRRQDGRAV